MKTRFFCIITFLLLISKSNVAQELSNLILESENLIKRTEMQLQFPAQTSVNFSLFRKEKINTSKNINKHKAKLKDLEANQYKKDFGLVFKANGNHNFRNIIDEDTNSYIRTSLRVEVEWNILKSGFIYNRIRAKRAENEKNALTLENEIKEKELWRRQFKINYNYVLNNEVLALNKNFLKFENEYFDFLNKLYVKKLIKRERIIKVSNQIGVLESLITTKNKENSILKDSVSPYYFSLKELPLFAINLDNYNQNNRANINQFAKNNVSLQHHYLNDINLSIYANQNYIETPLAGRFFPSIGFRFKAPLRFNNRKKIIETKIKILKAQEANKSLGAFNSSITQISAYNEKLKDLKNQYKSWQILEERIRILKIVKEDINEDKTGLLILDLMEEQFKVLQNTVQLKRQLYKIISWLYQLNNTDDIRGLIIPFQFKKTQTNEKFQLNESRLFSTQFQIDYLKAKNINTVVILKNKKALKSKLKEANISFVEKETSSLKSIADLIKTDASKLKNKS